MARKVILGSVCLIAGAWVASPAFAQDDETQAVLTQCSDPSAADLDSCLERARVLDETNPDPQIQALVGKLIQLQIHQTEQPQSGDATGAPRQLSGGAGGADVTPPDAPSPDVTPLQPYQPPPGADQRDVVPPDTQGNPANADVPTDGSTPPGDQNLHPLPPPNDGPGR